MRIIEEKEKGRIVIESQGTSEEILLGKIAKASRMESISATYATYGGINDSAGGPVVGAPNRVERLALYKN